MSTESLSTKGGSTTGATLTTGGGATIRGSTLTLGGGAIAGGKAGWRGEVGEWDQACF
jgi:hypothetical protein